jgi:hypothetical protein
MLRFSRQNRQDFCLLPFAFCFSSGLPGNIRDLSWPQRFQKSPNFAQLEREKGKKQKAKGKNAPLLPAEPPGFLPFAFCLLL